MQENSLTDLMRYAGGLGFRNFIHAWSYPGFRYCFYLRKSESARIPLRWFYQLMRKASGAWHGYHIRRGTRIGKGLYLSHYGNIVVHGKTILGDNCNLGHFVTLGKTHRGQLKGSPRIGSRVWIGTGAVVVGGIEIGDDVLIAPNAYVNFSVPAESIVIGNPGKIIPRKGATEGYITNLA